MPAGLGTLRYDDVRASFQRRPRLFKALWAARI
jgi:hypothetical protein